MNLHGRGPDSTRVLRGLRPGVLLTHAHPEHPGVAGPDWATDVHGRHRWCRLLAYFGISADPMDLGLARPARPSPAPRAVVVHPGCASVARRWSAQRYGLVARELAKIGLPVVVTGDADQRRLALQVAAAAGLPQRSVLAGRTGLVQLVADASLVVCGDTGFGSRFKQSPGYVVSDWSTRGAAPAIFRYSLISSWEGSMPTESA